MVSAMRYSCRKGTGSPTMQEAHSFPLALHEPGNNKKKNNEVEKVPALTLHNFDKQMYLTIKILKTVKKHDHNSKSSMVHNISLCLVFSYAN